MAITLCWPPSKHLACASPAAALMAFPAWPTSKKSYSLSERLGKPGDAASRPKPREELSPSRQYFVRVGLMPHVEDDPILGRREHLEQSDGKLHHAKARGQMTSSLRYGIDDKFPNLRRQLFERLDGQWFYVIWSLDGLE
jgi:hypothetical protein